MNRRKDWTLEYDDVAPPLPEEIHKQRSLRNLLPAGAYFIWIDPRIANSDNFKSPTVFAGILRIHHGRSRRGRRRPGKLARGFTNWLRWLLQQISRFFLGKATTGRKLGANGRCLSGSGDLYSYSRTQFENLRGEIKEEGLNDPKEPDDVARLERLHFPSQAHRYYLRLETGSELDNGWSLGFDTYTYESSERTWEKGQPITFELTDDDKTLILAGESALKIRNSQQTDVGELGLIRITRRTLRSARIVIHTPKDITPYGNNDDFNWNGLWNNSIYWNTALDGACWSLKRDVVEPNPALARGEWTRYQLKEYHRKSLGKGNPRGSTATPNDPWIYHFLMVDSILHGGDRPKGLMYDVGNVHRNANIDRAALDLEAGLEDHAQQSKRLKSDDSGRAPETQEAAQKPPKQSVKLDPDTEDLPRQGAAIAVNEIFKRPLQPEADAKDLVWTALHELGHMQGLYHNPIDDGLMRPVHKEDRYSQIEYSPIDEFRLMHLPDLWIRPGGIPYAYRYRASAVDVLAIVRETKGLTFGLSVEPNRVTLGTHPKWLILTLKNDSQKGILCPNRRHAEPENGRLGLTLHTPSGKQEEILPTRYPRNLTGFEGTSFLQEEAIAYHIEWDETWTELRQAGLYSLQANLLWYLETPSLAADKEHSVKEKGSDPRRDRSDDGYTKYRVSAAGDFRVVQ